MGPIVWNVKVDALPVGMDAGGLRGRVQERLDRVNDRMSTWQPDSQLSRFERHEGVDWFEVSPETARVIGRAIEIADLSSGAFDPTVAPLVDLWSFGDEDVPRRIPSDAEIDAARERVGWRAIEVRDDPPAIRRTRPGIALDLSAIAKGFAVDEVCRELEAAGIGGFLVEVGGELRTKGAKPDGEAWRVGIERPHEGLDRRVYRSLVIGNRALATSGDYRNYFDVDGVRYSHTIDPATGRPITHRLASVSIVADDCTTADAWATALMVLGPERGYDLAVEEGIAAYLLVRRADGTGFDELATPAFDRITTTSNAAANRPMSALTTVLVTFGVFLAAIAAMSIGVILSNRRIEGSCGGLANIKDRHGNSVCDACTNPLPTCGGTDEGRARDETVGAASSDRDA